MTGFDPKSVDPCARGDRCINPYRLFQGAVIPNCILRYPGLTPTEKITLARLFQYAGADGSCFPKQTTWAKECGLDVRRLKRVAAALERKGFIKRERPSGMEKVLHKTTRYFFPRHPAYEANNVPSQGDTLTPSQGDAVTPSLSKDTERESKEKEEKSLVPAINAPLLPCCPRCSAPKHGSECDRIIQLYHDRYREAHACCPTIPEGQAHGQVGRLLRIHGEQRVAAVVAGFVASASEKLAESRWRLSLLPAWFDEIAGALEKGVRHGTDRAGRAGGRARGAGIRVPAPPGAFRPEDQARI
jgi:hypothetical protein